MGPPRRAGLSVSARPADIVDSDNSRTDAEWSNWYATNPQDGWRATGVLLLSRRPDPSRRTTNQASVHVRRDALTLDECGATRLRRRLGGDLLDRVDRAYELMPFAAALLVRLWPRSTSRP